MPNLKCPICGEDGVLIPKTTVTNAKGRRYVYEKWYVYHNKTRKQKRVICRKNDWTIQKLNAR